MKATRFLFALGAVTLFLGVTPAQARNHHRHHGYWNNHRQVVYQNYHHYGYYRPVYRPLAPVIVIRP